METNKLVARLDAAAHYILLVVVFLLPLFTLPASWLALPMAKMALLGLGVLIALICWSIARLNEHRVVIPNINMLWTAPLLLGGYVIAAALSTRVLHAFIGFGFERDTVLSVATFIAALAVAALTTKSVRSFIRLQQAALASFIVLGTFQLARVFIGADSLLPSWFSTDATATVLGSWNDLAVFSGVVVLMTLSGLALISRKKLMRAGLYAALILALVLLAIVSLTVVWATLLAATFLLAIYIFSDASYDRESGKFKPRVPWVRLLPSVGVMLISVVFMLAGTTIGNAIADTFGVAHVDVRPSWEGTIVVGTGALSENPLLGVGPNAFRSAWVEYRPVAINETNFWNTDFSFGVGYIPSAFVAGGLLVGLLWVLFLASFVQLGFRMFGNRIVKPAHMYIAVSSYVGAAYLWILAIFYLPQTAMLAYTFILTGAAVAAAQVAGIVRTREIKAETSYGSGLALTGVVVLIAIVSFGALVVHAERVAASAMLARAVTAANNDNFARAEYIADRVSFFGSDIRAAQLKTNTGLAQMSETLNANVDEADVEIQRQKFQQELTKTLTAAREAIALNPDDYRNWLLIGDIYARLVPLNIDGSYESAIDAYEQAGTRNAKNPIIPVSIARLALVQDDLEMAREYAQKALELKGNYTDAYYLLSQVAIREGNTQEAISSTEAAALLRPDNAGLLFQLGILHYSLGDYERVVPVLERAIAVNSRYANALYFLGLAYDRVGNQQSALAAFERVAELNPDNEEVQSIITALTEGKTAIEALGEGAPAVSEPGSQLPLPEAR